jgi:anti-sigma B factor antagonist
MSGLKVEIQPGAKSEITVVALEGPLLIAHVPDFSRSAQQATTPVVVLDFSRSSYMDSAGLGAVLQLHKHLTGQQRRLVLVGLDQRIAALMKLTHADSVLEIHPDASSL